MKKLIIIIICCLSASLSFSQNIKIYMQVVRDTTGQQGATQAMVENMFCTLTSDFSGTSINFFWDGNILSRHHSLTFDRGIDLGNASRTYLSQYDRADGINI